MYIKFYFRLILFGAICFCVFSEVRAQSDVILKGENGFEAGYTHSILRGKDGNGAYLGFSLDGFVDITAAFEKVAKNTALGLGGAVHFWGKPDQIGVALNGNYIFIKDNNYFAYGGTVYANLVSNSAAMIPNLSFQWATDKSIGFTGVLGVRVVSNGPTGFAFSPQFVYNNATGPFFSFQIGLLLRSKNRGAEVGK